MLKMTHYHNRVKIRFLKSKISYGAQSNQKIDAFFKSKISYGAQSNQKKKKKLLGKNKISYGAQSNQKFEAFLKYLKKFEIMGRRRIASLERKRRKIKAQRKRRAVVKLATKSKGKTL